MRTPVFHLYRYALNFRRTVFRSGNIGGGASADNIEAHR